jgi:hypothetical protein
MDIDYEIDHYEVSITHSNGMLYSYSFFNEEEAVAYALNAGEQLISLKKVLRGVIYNDC